LVAELMTAGIPLVAALRRSDNELFGHPWRLMLLGDPLYGLEPARAARDSGEPISQSAPEARASGAAALAPANARGRLAVSDWQRFAPAHAHWPVVEVAAQLAGATTSSGMPESSSEDDRLAGCVNSALAALTHRPLEAQPAAPGAPPRALAGEALPANWKTVLLRIRRERLGEPLRAVFDELLIDTLIQTGSFVELQARLSRIPAGQCSSLVWATIEGCACSRLAQAAEVQSPELGYREALALWDEVIRVPWPPGRSFLAAFTERVAAMAEADPGRRLPAWQQRLTGALAALGASGDDSQAAALALVRAEGARVSSRLGLTRPRP
jgi:hypothetical protein